MTGIRRQYGLFLIAFMAWLTMGECTRRYVVAMIASIAQLQSLASSSSQKIMRPDLESIPQLLPDGLVYLMVLLKLSD